MKKQNLYVSIPKPCHEQWENMDATERGAFCRSCQKEVVDFSAMTDRAVIEYLSKAKNICGNFREDQVDRKMTLYKPYNGFLNWKIYLVGLLPVLGFKCQPEHVMMGKAMVQTDPERTAADDQKQVMPETITISGRVLDAANKPLEDADVSIADTLKYDVHTSTKTDSNGHFTLLIDSKEYKDKHLGLEVYHWRYYPSIIQLSGKAKQEYNVILKKERPMLRGDVSVREDK